MTSDPQRELARATKEEALQRVYRNANPEFRDAAYAMGVALAKARATFTSVDLRDELSIVAPQLTTHTDKVLGTVMRALARDGVIRKTDRVVNSGRARNHHRPVRVWESTVYPSGQRPLFPMDDLK